MDDNIARFGLPPIEDDDFFKTLNSMTETEKEHFILRCRDAESESDVGDLIRQVSISNTSDILAALVDTDFGNTTENSGIK